MPNSIRRLVGQPLLKRVHRRASTCLNRFGIAGVGFNRCQARSGGRTGAECNSASGRPTPVETGSPSRLNLFEPVWHSRRRFQPMPGPQRRTHRRRMNSASGRPTPVETGSPSRLNLFEQVWHGRRRFQPMPGPQRRTHRRRMNSASGMPNPVETGSPLRLNLFEQVWHGRRRFQPMPGPPMPRARHPPGTGRASA